MVDVKDYGEYETAWCPGCGNFGILKAVKRALAESGIEPHRAVMVSGIGQAAKAPQYLNANMFNGLHGRALPVATGIKLANSALTVVVESGDGCNYGEGGNHFLAAIRRNIDITVLTHDNQIYGLTKGQPSPTSAVGFKAKAQPLGVMSDPFNPVAVAVAMKAGFVARSFSGMEEHLVTVIKKAIAHTGFSLVDIMQPCVSFNHLNTFKWYRDRCGELPARHDPADWESAMKTARKFGDEIPVGVIYRNEERPPYGINFPALKGKPLVEMENEAGVIEEIITAYA